MQEIKIKVISWDEHQPKSDRVRHKHWFKVKMDCGMSHGLFGLSAEQRWFFIQLLCECCRKNSDTVVIRVDRFLHLCNISETSMMSAIKMLEENGTVKILSVHSQSSVMPLTTHNRTGHNRTGNKITEQKMSIDADAAQSASPLKGSSNSRLIAKYKTAYKARYNAYPVIDVKTQGLVKTILRSMSEEQACDMVQAFVQMNDPWFVKKAHDFPTFYENLTKVSMALQTGQDHGAPPREKTLKELLEEDEKNGSAILPTTNG